MVFFGPGDRRCRADIATAMKFRGPRPAGECLAVHPDELRQIPIADLFRRKPVEDIRNRASHGHRTMKGNIRLGQQITDREGDRVRRGCLLIVEAHGATFVNLGGDLIPK